MEPNGDGGPATLATLYSSMEVLVARTYGHVYVAEQGFGSGGRVRKIDRQTSISTAAGGPAIKFGIPAINDGGLATLGGLRWPTALAMAKDGALYIADGTSNANLVAGGVRVRKVAC